MMVGRVYCMSSFLIFHTIADLKEYFVGSIKD